MPSRPSNRNLEPGHDFILSRQRKKNQFLAERIYRWARSIHAPTKVTESKNLEYFEIEDQLFQLRLEQETALDTINGLLTHTKNFDVDAYSDFKMTISIVFDCFQHIKSFSNSRLDQRLKQVRSSFARLRSVTSCSFFIAIE